MQTEAMPQTLLPPATVTATPPGVSRWRVGGARYTLPPGLSLIPEPDNGGLLFALRPLMAMRLNGEAFALLSALAAGSTTAAEAATTAGVAGPDAAAFFDRLAGRRLLLRLPPPPNHWPQVSVIIAARGRPTATRACIQSLLVLDYPADRIEIIVVDDASEQPLASALAGLPIRLIRLDCNLGQSAARNLAAAEAEGEVLAFIDNDCVADPGWLRTLVPYLEDPALAIVGGRVIAPPPTGRITAFEAVRSPLDMGAIASPVGPDEAVAYLPTCNFIVRRDTLLAVGGFTAKMRLGEDVDFTWRVLRSGAGACYVPAGQITHYHRERLAALLRRRADYGSSEADLQRRHPASHRVLPIPRLSLLVLAVLTMLIAAWPMALVLAPLIAALLGHEVISKQRQIRRLGIALPVARVAAAVLREHLASMHGLSANVIRYYALPLIGLAALWPVLLPAMAVLLLFAPLIDHLRLQPACGLAVFVGLYWLEMAAYQLGVWRGCLAHRTFGPLLPILHWSK